MERKRLIDPQGFSKALQDTLASLYEVFEQARETKLAPTSPEGVIRYLEEYGKNYFQVAGQFERPSEFLRTLLDMIRVCFEAGPGTFFLNGNPGFLLDGLPNQSFRLGYLSLLSEPDQSFEAFWSDTVVPVLETRGYPLDEVTRLFAVVSMGRQRFSLEFMADVQRLLGAGFSAEEAMQLIQSDMSPDVSRPSKQAYVGFCKAPELETRLRLSLWLILLPRSDMTH